MRPPSRLTSTWASPPSLATTSPPRWASACRSDWPSRDTPRHVRPPSDERIRPSSGATGEPVPGWPEPTRRSGPVNENASPRSALPERPPALTRTRIRSIRSLPRVTRKVPALVAISSDPSRGFTASEPT